jgi:hypothetical protein
VGATVPAGATRRNEPKAGIRADLGPAGAGPWSEPVWSGAIVIPTGSLPLTPLPSVITASAVIRATLPAPDWLNQTEPSGVARRASKTYRETP